MINFLDKKYNEISKVCIQHGVKQLDVFGSAIRDDFKPAESDLDLLVEFKPMELYDRVNAYFGLLDDLRVLLGDRIHLVMIGAIKNPYITHDIEQTKRVLYAA